MHRGYLLYSRETTLDPMYGSSRIPSRIIWSYKEFLFSRGEDKTHLLFKILNEDGFLRYGQGVTAALSVKGLLAAEELSSVPY